jgi:L,D-transpeptidase ErfK/SrfK
VKVGLRQGRVYVEVHEDDTVAPAPLDVALRLLGERRLLQRVDPRKLEAAVHARRGIPVNVTADPG